MVKKMVNIYDIKDLGKNKILHPKLAFDDSWEKIVGVSTKSLMTLPLVYGGHLTGVLQLVNKKDMKVFSTRDERTGFLVAQELALALYDQKKNEPAVVESTGSLSQAPGSSDFSETAKQDISANILVQREDDETTILVRILKDGSRCVYQQIDPPKDVIKLIREVANIDLNLPPNPYRRKVDPGD
jgi:hypothetical protein